MQKIVAGVGIGFDVVDEHPAGGGQLGQGCGRLAWLHRQAQRLPPLLHEGLGHQPRRHLAVLLAVHLQRIGQILWISRGQGTQLGQAELEDKSRRLAPMPLTSLRWPCAAAS